MGQPACLENQKFIVTLEANFCSQMARLCTRRNSGGTFIDNSNIPNLTSAVFCITTSALVQIPIPAQAPVFTLTFTSALGPPRRYTNKNLQKAIKLALKIFAKGQKYDQLQTNSARFKQSLKVGFHDLYYRNSHLDCYYFC